VLGAYIDLATGSIHNFSPGMVVVDGEPAELKGKVAKNYNLKKPTFQNRPLVPLTQYEPEWLQQKIKNISGWYQIATNARLFLQQTDTTTIQGLILFENGEECILKGEIVIATVDLIRIKGDLQLITEPVKNVEYDILPGEATFQIDFDDEITLTTNHAGNLLSYTAKRTAYHAN